MRLGGGATCDDQSQSNFERPWQAGGTSRRGIRNRAARSAAETGALAGAHPAAALAAPDFSLSLRLDQCGRGGSPDHPSLDSGVDRQLPAALVPEPSYVCFERLLPWHLQWLGTARRLDWILGGASLPRAHLAATPPAGTLIPIPFPLRYADTLRKARRRSLRGIPT